MGIEIRPYGFGEEPKIISLWDKCLDKDPINLEVFERKIILDPNFEADGFLLAEGKGELLGFSYNIVRQYPYFKEEAERDKDKGWIVAFGVVPEAYGSDIGDRLIQESIKYHKGKRRKVIIYGMYLPNYFTPGLDADSYPHEYNILKRNGFKDVAASFGMDANLWPMFEHLENIAKIEEKLREEGIEVRGLTSRYLNPLMTFLRKYWQGDWYRHARELLLHNRKEQVIIAAKGHEVVGYCQFWGGEGYEWYMPGSHFGPFGVREDMRRRGIGRVLLYKCLRAMKENGVHNAFFMSTGADARRLYERLGFKASRVWRHMKMEVES